MTVSGTSSTSSSSASSSSSLPSNTISSQDFLSLLVSELQNQDPLNATSVTDFITQMTSYANFSQQQSINTNLNALAGAFSSLVTLNSVNYVGHNVEAKTDTAALTNGSATYGYSLSGAATNLAIPPKDSPANTAWAAPATGKPGSH